MNEWQQNSEILTEQWGFFLKHVFNMLNNWRMHLAILLLGMIIAHILNNSSDSFPFSSLGQILCIIWHKEANTKTAIKLKFYSGQITSEWSGFMNFLYFETAVSCP